MTPGGCEIIVVDDDVSMSLAIERLLAAAGWTVRTYGSAEDLLADGNFSSAAVLVLDIQLPGMSGLELYRQLRTEGGVPPVIFITAQDRADIRGMVRETGRTSFFTKPFDGTELIQAIRHHLPTD
jgi:FixJ family two-component response regulator